MSNTRIVETQAAISRVTKYYYHGGQRVAMRQGSVVYYLHTDHLGSTSLTTDEDGDVVARQLYHPYGTVRWSEGTLPTDFGFTGQREHPGLGLVFMHARYYHPGLGRWTQADTIATGIGSQGLNRYMYVRGNPVLYNDPSGHVDPVTVIIITTLVVAFLSGCSSTPAHPPPTSGETQFHYSEQYGWFDDSHFHDHNVLGEVRDVVAAGGGKFTLQESQVWDMHLDKTYWVSGDVTEDQISGVSLAIFMDFQGGWENWQEENGEFFTAYAIEDLPSNMLAFIARYMETTPEALLDELGAYPTHKHPPNPELGGPTAGFLPKRLNPETGQYEEVSWPWNLPNPINNPNLWKPVSARKVPLLGGDPRYFHYE